MRTLHKNPTDISSFLLQTFQLERVRRTPLEFTPAILAKYIKSSSVRYRHILAVVQKSDEADEAWLHDIGYSPLLNRTGFHPLDSALFAVENGFPDEVVKTVAFHSGAYEVAMNLGGVIAMIYTQLLAFLSKSDHKRIDRFTAWDITTSPSGEDVDVEDRIQEILTRYPKDTAVHKATVRLTPYYIKVADKYL